MQFLVRLRAAGLKARHVSWSRRGASGVEYGLLLGLVVVAVIAATTHLGGSVQAVLCFAARSMGNVTAMNISQTCKTSGIVAGAVTLTPAGDVGVGTSVPVSTILAQVQDMTPGGTIASVVVSNPVNGTLPSNTSVGISGSFTFTPTSVGSTGFTYTVTDQFGATASNTVSLAVVAQAIVLTSPTVSGTFYVGSVVPVPLTTLTGAATDPNTGGTVSVNVSMSSGVKGTVTTGTGGNFTFTPTATGSATFTFTATDQYGATSNTATVTIPVSVTQAITLTSPTVSGTTLYLGMTSPVTVQLSTLKSAATDPNTGATVSVNVNMSSGVNGTVTTGTGGNFTFTPATTATVNPTFTFTATDQFGATSNTATVTIPMSTAQNCQTLYTAQSTLPNGPYLIEPGSTPVTVYCDMADDGGGWTMIESFNGSQVTPSFTAAGSQVVTPGSNLYVATSVAEALAGIGSAIRIQQHSLVSTMWARSKTGVPLTRLASGLILNDVPTAPVTSPPKTIYGSADWTFGNASISMDFNVGADTDINNCGRSYLNSVTYPDIYWSCSNGSGLHIYNIAENSGQTGFTETGSPLAAWTPGGGVIDLDIMVR